MKNVIIGALFAAGSVGLMVSESSHGQGESAGEMSFFVTSAGPGKGANLGGIEGADQHCQNLAEAAGAGARTWRAYLSTQGAKLNDPDVVHARDRIGSGPWHNAKAVLIAENVDNLHSTSSNLNLEAALDENGKNVNGRTEKPNKHDILTGSRPDGTAFAGAFFPDMTCGNWTKDGTEGSATMIASVRSTILGRSPGIPRTRHVDVTRTDSVAPAVTVCSIASLQTRRQTASYWGLMPLIA